MNGSSYHPIWRKAQRSVAFGDCVEVSAAPGKVSVRDSKNPDGQVIGYAANAWIAFTNAAKRGCFDVVAR
jgi:hypothetical protein